jgi:DnaJ-class molecular chaperone
VKSIDQFRLICESYEILKNDDTRTQYLLDKNGHNWEGNKINRYNDVRSDFERAAQKERKYSSLLLKVKVRASAVVMSRVETKIRVRIKVR